MQYKSFGTGKQNLIIIPGLGDALKNADKTARAFASMYQTFVETYKIYVFTFDHGPDAPVSTKQMAKEIGDILERIGLEKVYVLGISEGGMIAQYLTLYRADMVEKLVLAVTACRPNAAFEAVLSGWIGMLRKDDFKAFFIDVIEKTYTEKRLNVYRPFYDLWSSLYAQKSKVNLIRQIMACQDHDCYEAIDGIRCPTLIIGGGRDQIVGCQASEEMAARIPESRLLIYQELGHGAYEEADDFVDQIQGFLNMTEQKYKK